jgi:hypothetical protein
MKTSLKFLVLFVAVLVMKSYSQTVIETGKFAVNPTTPAYTLDKGSDERVVTVEIKFTKKFTSKPDIIINVNGIDASKDTNLRFGIEPSFVSTDGFLIKVSTWSDSKIFGLSGTWTAIGQ